jgi:hypothetical protein
MIFSLLSPPPLSHLDPSLAPRSTPLALLLRHLSLDHSTRYFAVVVPRKSHVLSTSQVWIYLIATLAGGAVAGLTFEHAFLKEHN